MLTFAQLLNSTCLNNPKFCCCITQKIGSNVIRFKSPSGHRLSWLRFSWFLSVTPGKFEDSASVRPDPLLPNPSSFINYPTIRLSLIYIDKQTTNRNNIEERVFCSCRSIPAHSRSLYWLSYPGSWWLKILLHEVLSAAITNNAISLDVVSWNPVELNRHFGINCFLHLQGRKASHISDQQTRSSSVGAF
jgi:hypothetical protein